jgi:hypothetical protein
MHRALSVLSPSSMDRSHDLESASLADQRSRPCSGSFRRGDMARCNHARNDDARACTSLVSANPTRECPPASVQRPLL